MKWDRRRIGFDNLSNFIHSNVPKLKSSKKKGKKTTEGFFWHHSRKSMALAFASNHLKRMAKTVERKTQDFIVD